MALLRASGPMVADLSRSALSPRLCDHVRMLAGRHGRCREGWICSRNSFDGASRRPPQWMTPMPVLRFLSVAKDSSLSTWRGTLSRIRVRQVNARNSGWYWFVGLSFQLGNLSSRYACLCPLRHSTHVGASFFLMPHRWPGRPPGTLWT